jgi:lycopene beta-cyclase
MSSETFDYLLIGGGLHNSLIALAIFARSPDASVCLVERESELGGNHVWCFHAGDLGPEAEALVTALVIRRWAGYSVRFPNFERRLASAYAAVSSEQLSQVVRAAFAGQPRSRLVLRSSASGVEATTATLSTGERIYAKVVIDARGPEAHSGAHIIGYQKFVGLELVLREPTTLSEPIVMDATVPQQDGFRFVYALPFTATRVLIEDTYFSDHSELDRATLRARALEYASDLGLDVAEVAREEVGVLPLPASSSTPRAGSPLLAGYAGGWFHPTTGYSFPIAARLALHIAACAPDAVFDQRFLALASEHARQQRYACLLNRLLFQAAPPSARRNVLERFYRLPEASIARFYALSTTSFDRARIICGRPPRGLSIARAITKGLLS